MNCNVHVKNVDKIRFGYIYGTSDLRRLRRNAINAISLLEVVLSAIISFVFEKIIKFTWGKIKGIRFRKKKGQSIISRIDSANFRLLCSLLELHPAEIKFCVSRAYNKYGFLRASLKSFIEIYTYSIRQRIKHRY